MVTEKRIAQFSLALALIGLTALLLIAQTTATETKIKDIDKSMEGRTVRVNAKIASVTQKNRTTIMMLDDSTGKIEAVEFQQAGTPHLEKNSFATLEGKIQDYKGKIQLVIEKAQKWE